MNNCSVWKDSIISGGQFKLMRISVSIVREKSLDPVFQVKVSYEDENVSFKNAIVDVLRQPPRVKILYPEEVQRVLPEINQRSWNWRF